MSVVVLLAGWDCRNRDAGGRDDLPSRGLFAGTDSVEASLGHQGAEQNQAVQLMVDADRFLGE